jgi:hypothetical protein
MNYELKVLNCLMDMICPHCSTLRKRVSYFFFTGREASRDGKEGKVNQDRGKEAGEKERKRKRKKDEEEERE